MNKKENNNETGIIFVDVAKDVAENIEKVKQPLLQKFHRMKKLQSIFILLLLTLTIFSSINLLSTASASPPSTGDKAFANASVSYDVPTSASPSANTVTLTAAENTTEANMVVNINSKWVENSAGTEAWLNITNGMGMYLYAGSTFQLSTQSYIGSLPASGASVGNISATFFVLSGGNIFSGSSNYVFNYETTNSNVAVNFTLSASVPVSGTLDGINFAETCDPGFTWYTPSGDGAPAHLYSVPLTSNLVPVTKGVSAAGVSVPVGLGWNYVPISSSFSSQVPSNPISFKIYWSAQYPSTATYNGNAYTTSPITGTVGTYTISFSSNTNHPFTSYTASYNETFIYAVPTTTSYTTQTYSYSISQNGNYFNSSFLFFNYTLPSNALTTYSASYSAKVSNLTLTNPSAPVDQFSLNSQNFTYYVLSKYKSTYNITAYKNYSSAQNANTKFSTSEIANYYPTLNYDAVKWTGTGSKAELILNATTIGGGYTFSSESLQVLNVNWGDSSPLQSSTIQTGQYNWTLYHYYQSTGSYSVSFQIENWVGNANALSTTKTLTYDITIGIITSPANNAILTKGEKIYFNWTNQNAGMTSVSLSIDSLTQLNNIYLSQLTDSVSFTPTYLGSLTISWHWVAGNISGFSNLTYSTSSSIAKTGLYVLVNFTLSAQAYSNYYYYSQVSPYNLTWSYFTWNVQLPNGSSLSSIKGNGSWIFQSAFPGLYVYYTANSSIHYYQKSTFYQVVWLAPLPPSYGYFTISYAPTSPVMQMLGIGFGANAFKTYVNGVNVPSTQINSRVGQTYSIKAYDTFGSLVVNTSYTPQYQFSTDTIYVSYFPITFTNLNSSWKIAITMESNSITVYGIPHIMPEGGELTLYVPPGSYYINATYLGYLNNTPGISIDKLTTISNVTDEVFSGITLAEVQTTAIKNAQNITNLVDSVNITFVNSNSKILNQTLLVNVSVKDVNTSIQNVLTKIYSNITFVKSLINNMNISMTTKLSVLQSTLNSLSSNVSVSDKFLNNTINTIRSMTTTLTQNVSLLNTTINILKLVASQNFTAINSTLKKNLADMYSNFTLIHSVINSVNLSINTKLNFLESLMNNTNVSVVAKLSVLNTTLKDINLSMSNKLTLVNDTVNSLNASLKTQVNEIMDSINSSKLNISTKITVIKGLLGIVMNKQNVSSVDRIQLSDPQVLGNNTYSFVVNVYTPSGAPVNLSVTQYVASNLILKFVQGYDAQPLAYSVSNIQPGSFVITIFGMNSTNIASLNSNNAVVTVSSDTSANKSANVVALGLLGSFLAGNQWQHTLLILFQPIVWRISAMDILLTLISLYAFLVVSRFMRQSKAGRKKAWLNAKYHLFLWSIAFLAWFLMYAAYRGGML